MGGGHGGSGYYLKVGIHELLHPMRHGLHHKVDAAERQTTDLADRRLKLTDEAGDEEGGGAASKVGDRAVHLRKAHNRARFLGASECTGRVATHMYPCRSGYHHGGGRRKKWGVRTSEWGGGLSA